MRNPAYYRKLWATMQILPGWCARVDRAAVLVRKYRKTLYDDLPAPWELVGVIHYMECGCRPDRQIFNGEQWDQKTVLYPPNHGPWPSWRDAAIEALARHPLKTLRDIEAWNGYGYQRRGVNSPYLWSGSNHGVGVGKYVADGQYDPDAVSKQIGAALVLSALGWKPAAMPLKGQAK